MKNKTKKIYVIYIIILLIVVILSSVLFLLFRTEDKKEEGNNNVQVLENIKLHYNQYVVTNKEARIYELNNSNMYK